MQIFLMICVVWTSLDLFAHYFVFFCAGCLSSGSLWSASVAIDTLAFLVMPSISGTTKKLYQYLMPALTIVTQYMPICGMHELFQEYNNFVMDLFSRFIFVCEKSILYILMGIKLPSVPMSISHLCVSVL